MTTTSDTSASAAKRTLYYRFNRWLERHMPGGLYRRALIIIIVPMVLLQSIVGSLFAERHWARVTRDLSKAVARDIAFVEATYQAMTNPSARDLTALQNRVNAKLILGMTIERDTKLPAVRPKPLFSLVDQRLSRYIARYIGKPFWIDTLSQPRLIDIRLQVEPGVIFRFLIRDKRAAAANTHRFFVWMVLSSLLLLGIAIIFLRNQIKPILRLADAAQRFGMGRDVENFYPHGATEVQAAARAFLEMKRRIERQVEQRTTMLAGVSHDIGTILTRFKLELALIDDNPTVAAMKQDVDEMQRMLEGYMSFVRGDADEKVQTCDIEAILKEIQAAVKRSGRDIKLRVPPRLSGDVKPSAFKRCIENLVTNAARYASEVEITAELTDKYLLVRIDDNGPGIPKNKHEHVFRPFTRLDDARNMDQAGTGLGLSIARDIAQNHGGDITLGQAPQGGLCAEVRIPV